MARNSNNFFSRILDTLVPRRVFKRIPLKLLENPTTRHYIRVVAFVVLGMSVGALITNEFINPSTYIIDNVREIPVEESVTALGQDAYTISESKPMMLKIPSIGLQTTFEAPLGLNADRSVQVPKSFEKVGWYKYSPTPGELGPAVILGHVDSYQGPAVFFSIGQLKQGDPIEITREDGSVATFLVTGIGRYEQEGFPTELVYGNIDHAGLRLVTCSGTFDHGTQRYSHNTVVYAELEEPEEETSSASESE